MVFCNPWGLLEETITKIFKKLNLNSVNKRILRNYVRLAHVGDTFDSNEIREMYPYQPAYSRWNNNPVFMKQKQEVNYWETCQYNREQRPLIFQNYQRDQYYP